MKLHALAAAALALAAVTTSHATITPVDSDSGSELVFEFYSTSGSYALDLGITLQSFSDLQTNAGYSRTWVVNPTTDTYFSQALTALGTTTSTRWAVVGGDSTGDPGTPGHQRVLTTVQTGQNVGFWQNNLFRNTIGNMGTSFVAVLNQLGINDTGDNLEGNHADVANGASFSPNTSGAFFGFEGSVGDVLGQGASFKVGNAIGGTSRFAYITPGSPFPQQSVQSSLVGNGTSLGLWSFAASTTTAGAYELSYSLAAVPEPGALALMLAGLAGVGFVARRRGNA